MFRAGDPRIGDVMGIRGLDKLTQDRKKVVEILSEEEIQEEKNRHIMSPLHKVETGRPKLARELLWRENREEGIK